MTQRAVETKPCIPQRKPGKRYIIGEVLPEYLEYTPIKDLVLQRFGFAPSWREFRKMVEDGTIPSIAHPFRKTNIPGQRVRLYRWNEVESALVKVVADVQAKDQGKKKGGVHASV